MNAVTARAFVDFVLQIHIDRQREAHPAWVSAFVRGTTYDIAMFYGRSLGQPFATTTFDGLESTFYVGPRLIHTPLMLAYSVTHEIGHVIVGKVFDGFDGKVFDGFDAYGNLQRLPFRSNDGHGAVWANVVQQLGIVPQPTDPCNLWARADQYDPTLLAAFERLPKVVEMEDF